MDVSSEMIHALLPLYLVTVMGATTLEVGVIEGIAESTVAVAKLFAGALSDRLGRRKSLAVTGYTLAALAKPLFPLAPGIAWLVAARFLDRIGKGIRGAPRDALVADLAPPEQRGAAFGLRQALDTAGAVLGPLLAIGLMLATADNFRAVFWIAVLPAFVSVAIIALAVREPPRQAVARPEMPFSRAGIARLGAAFWLLTAIATLFTLARFSEAFLILRAQRSGLPLAFAPAVLVTMNLVYTASAYPAGALSDRMDRGRLLAGGLVLLVAADLVLAFDPALPGVALGVALWGLHMGATQGLLARLVADIAPEDLRGTAFGTFNLITGLATLTASIVAGALWDLAGPAATFLAGAGLATLAIGALLASGSRLRAGGRTY